jgi:hypothetical protein
LKKQVAFAALKDSWYEGPVGARIQLQDLTKWLRGQNENEANLAALRRDISTNTTALTALMTGLPTSTLFDALKAEIQAELTYLEDMDKRAMLKIVALADFAAVSSGT